MQLSDGRQDIMQGRELQVVLPWEGTQGVFEGHGPSLP